MRKSGAYIDDISLRAMLRGRIHFSVNQLSRQDRMRTRVPKSANPELTSYEIETSQNGPPTYRRQQRAELSEFEDLTKNFIEAHWLLIRGY